jgi:FkbM family methyltransferase
MNRQSLVLDITPFSPAINLLHRIAPLRKLMKRVARRLVLTQRFHGGRIAFNAVTHAWAWTGNRRYENFDRPLQDRLLELSRDRPQFLDIGANVGAMTLAVLLRNAHVRAVAVEPGNEAAALFRRSIAINRLHERCELLQVAASATADRLHFDDSGSVMGRVVNEGTEITAIPLATLADRVAAGKPLLAKIDVEGFETALVPVLRDRPLCAGSCVVIELHPAGFNGMGDPFACFAALRSRGNLDLRTLGGANLGTVNASDFNQIEVHWK